MDAIKNFAKVTVSTGYDASAISIALSSGEGAKLPAPATDGAFNLVWWNSTDYPDPSDDPNVEIVRCTGRLTDTLTVTRGQEGTLASTKNTADKVYKMMLTVTKKTMDDLETITELQHETTGTHKLTTYSTLYAPEGFLVNGKIVPSVASNNLTVAIKGMDGNDPSVSNPVYVRIGNTVRTITSALSKSLSAGANWFNAGGSELATKEIDYFVYLGYNATDGVVVGFSRIPYGTLYSDFSTTTTNEKYCAISTITNATAGDNYVNVGRFAATLSAGAGYTWTVPTFTATNLIQRPVYESRWLDYTGYTNITLGNSTLVQKYKVTKEDYEVYVYFQFGSSGASFGGSVRFASPFVTRSSYFQNVSANLVMQISTIYQGQVLSNYNVTNLFELFIANSYQSVDATHPATWVNGSRFSFLIKVPLSALG